MDKFTAAALAAENAVLFATESEEAADNAAQVAIYLGEVYPEVDVGAALRRAAVVAAAAGTVRRIAAGVLARAETFGA